MSSCFWRVIVLHVNTFLPLLTMTTSCWGQPFFLRWPAFMFSISLLYCTLHAAERMRLFILLATELFENGGEGGKIENILAFFEVILDWGYFYLVQALFVCVLYSSDLLMTADTTNTHAVLITCTRSFNLRFLSIFHFLSELAALVSLFRLLAPIAVKASHTVCLHLMTPYSLLILATSKPPMHVNFNLFFAILQSRAKIISCRNPNCFKLTA